jgi:SAM-dependent methyltransferase
MEVVFVDSSYVRYGIADIVLDDLWKSGFDVREIEIRNGFTITDLVSVCSNVYYPNVSKGDVRDAVFRARAHAFTMKYSQPREDEKMIPPSDLKVAGLAAWTSYVSEILTGLSINVDRDRLIDVGAGHAQANVELYRDAKNLTLVDISADALALAKHSLPLARTFNASAEDLTGIGNDSVDVYFSFRTYQSTLFDIRSALHEAYRILSRKGWLVLSIPIMYLKKDGTVAKGLLRSGSEEPSIEYASQVAQRIADAASCLQFQSVRVDERSPFELFIVGERV